MATCPNCGNETGEGALFCDQCGTRLPQPEPEAESSSEVTAASTGATVICPACGAGNVPGEAFCDCCGSPLEAPVPTAETRPEPEPVASEAELSITAEEAPPEEDSISPATIEADTTPRCPACGAEVAPDEAFCPDCGASLAEAPLPPEAIPEEEPEPAIEEPQPTPDVAAEASLPTDEEEEAAPSPTRPQPLNCPACGAEVEPSDSFCSNCGASLQQAPPIPAPQPAETVPAVTAPEVTPASAGARFVVADTGAEIPLPEKDDILIGREDPVSGIYPDVDLTPHGGETGGVSRKHAHLIMEGNRYYVEDLDSTNFTFVNKQKLQPRTRQPVAGGDEIRCGRVTLVLHID